MQLFNTLRRYLFKPATLLGITLDPTTLRMVELAQENDDYVLRHCSQTPLPSVHYSSQSFSFDHPAFPDFLKSCIQTNKVSAQQVAIALPHSSVLFKNIELDKSLNETEIDIQLRTHAAQHFSYSPADLMVDFEIIGDSEKHAGLQEVRWVAARKSQVTPKAKAVEAAGLSVIAVEVDSFSLQRAVNYYLNKYKRTSEKVIVVQVYNSHLLFIVLYRGACLFSHVETSRGDNVETLSSFIRSQIIAISDHFSGENMESPVSLVLLSGVICSELLINIQRACCVEARCLEVVSLLDRNCSPSIVVPAKVEIYPYDGSQPVDGSLVISAESGTHSFSRKAVRERIATLDPTISSEPGSEFSVAVGLAMRVGL